MTKSATYMALEFTHHSLEPSNTRHSFNILESSEKFLPAAMASNYELQYFGQLLEVNCVYLTAN